MNNPVLTLDEITPAWLSELLRCDVTAVSAMPIGTGQVGATYRLNLEGPGAPPSIVAKLPSNDDLSRATGKSHLTYIRESRFYQQFAGRKPMAIPDHLYIGFDEDSHAFTLIMHDLPRHVAGNQLNFPSHEDAMLAMDAAASIHAAWWGDPMLDRMEWLNGSKAVPPPLDLEAVYAMFWPAFSDRYGERITAEMRCVGDAYLGKIGEWMALRDGPRCLTHNDFRPDNMLFDPGDPEKPIVIVDWQTVGVGTGAGDIAYYAGTALDPDTRAHDEAALLARYREGLLKNGVQEADLSDLWDVYRASAFAGFLMGATAAMVVGQTERGDAMFLAMCERSARMVLDHAEVALPA
jgi:Phosphotransferase enzyme family